jgi:hypothetical protein
METSVWRQPLFETYVLSALEESVLPLLEQLQYQKGEERLMLAVLKDAVECIERYRTGCGVHSRPTYDEALQWVRTHDRIWPFSFENICLGLDLDPDRLRSFLVLQRPSQVHLARRFR